jgi:hypothetical protein
MLVLLLLVSFPRTADTQEPQPCFKASRLTDDEARILLYVTPDAVRARTAGTDVDIIDSPMEGFAPKDFFVGLLQSQKPTSDSVFGNGILGYFAVDKRTGDVESLSDFTPVNGKELMRVQTWMRLSHGIQLQRGSAERSSAELCAFQHYSAALQIMANPKSNTPEKGRDHADQPQRNH